MIDGFGAIRWHSVPDGNCRVAVSEQKWLDKQSFPVFGVFIPEFDVSQNLPRVFVFIAVKLDLVS